MFFRMLLLDAQSALDGASPRRFRPTYAWRERGAPVQGLGAGWNPLPKADPEGPALISYAALQQGFTSPSTRSMLLQHTSCEAFRRVDAYRTLAAKAKDSLLHHVQARARCGEDKSEPETCGLIGQLGTFSPGLKP
jgi:hypothetical protein